MLRPAKGVQTPPWRRWFAVGLEEFLGCRGDYPAGAGVVVIASLSVHVRSCTC